MTITLDTDADFADGIFDFPVTATHTRVYGNGSPDLTYPDEVTGVAENITSTVTEMGGVQYAANSTVFHMRASTFTSAPIRGDKFTVASGTHAGAWVIKSADKALDGAEYTCPAQRLEG